MSSPITVETRSGIRTILLNRPDKHNALTGPMLTDLHDLFHQEPDPDERVTVIRGAGPSFCSGRDLRGRQAGNWADEISIESVFQSVLDYPLPVVSVVHGDAIAGGNELALHSDFVIASSQARFGMPLVQLGMAPNWFLVKRIVEVGGPIFARRMLLLGDLLPSTELAALGIIHQAVEPSQLDDAVNSLLHRLAHNAPLSLRAIKATINRQMDFRESILHQDIDAAITHASRSQDAVEGVQAKLERRTPVFRGV